VWIVNITSAPDPLTELRGLLKGGGTRQGKMGKKEEGRERKGRERRGRVSPCPSPPPVFNS